MLNSNSPLSIATFVYFSNILLALYSHLYTSTIPHTQHLQLIIIVTLNCQNECGGLPWQALVAAIKDLINAKEVLV